MMSLHRPVFHLLGAFVFGVEGGANAVTGGAGARVGRHAELG